MMRLRTPLVAMTFLLSTALTASAADKPCPDGRTADADRIRAVLADWAGVYEEHCAHGRRSCKPFRLTVKAGGEVTVVGSKENLQEPYASIDFIAACDTAAIFQPKPEGSRRAPLYLIVKHGDVAYTATGKCFPNGRCLLSLGWSREGAGPGQSHVVSVSIDDGPPKPVERKQGSTSRPVQK